VRTPPPAAITGPRLSAVSSIGTPAIWASTMARSLLATGRHWLDGTVEVVEALRPTVFMPPDRVLVAEAGMCEARRGGPRGLLELDLDQRLPLVVSVY
jgi:hypothetical protein